MAGTALACLRICRTGFIWYFGNQPCVPEAFKGLEIENLNYQSAKLTVKTSGVGTVEYVILDGEKVDFIPYGLTGNHIVHIKLKN